MKQQRIGWIGLGAMGNPIVKNLIKAGFKVKVYNRTREKEKEAIAAGATPGESPQKLVRDCDVVFTMVSDDKAVKEVFEGEKGLLTEENSNKLIVDMSTVAPETSKYLALKCRSKQIDFLEAPVSGSVKQAENAALIIMVGGEEKAFQRAKSIFESISKITLYLGANGMGSSAKLSINYLVALTIQSLAETVLFAEKQGLRKEDILTIINESACASTLTKLKANSILKEDYPAAFALKLMAKDLRLMKDVNLKSPLFEPVYNSFQQAQNDNLGDEDLMAIIKYLDK